MGFVDRLTGKTAAQAASEAGEIQAGAATEAAEIGRQTALDVAGLQEKASREAGEIQALSALESAGTLSEAQRGSLAELRQSFAGTQTQIQQSQQQLGQFGQGLEPFRETELAGLQRQQQALGGQAQLAGGAQQQLGQLLGFGGQQAQQEAQRGVLDSPAQQALRERAARLSTRTASAIGGLGGGNIRSALFEQGRALDAQALQNRIGQLGQVSQFGTQGLGLGGTGLQTGLAGQQAQLGTQGALLGSQQAQQIASGATDIGRAIAGGQLGAGQARAAGTAGAGLAAAQGLAGAGAAQQAGLIDPAQALASGKLGAEQARSQGLGNLLQAGATVAGAFSDIRLKENIIEVERMDNGLMLYEWDWTDQAKEMVGDQMSTGFMAHEVAAKYPEAVSIRNGYMTVDYGSIPCH